MRPDFLDLFISFLYITIISYLLAFTCKDALGGTGKRTFGIWVYCTSAFAAWLIILPILDFAFLNEANSETWSRLQKPLIANFSYVRVLISMCFIANLCLFFLRSISILLFAAILMVKLFFGIEVTTASSHSNAFWISLLAWSIHVFPLLYSLYLHRAGHISWRRKQEV